MSKLFFRTIVNPIGLAILPGPSGIILQLDPVLGREDMPVACSGSWTNTKMGPEREWRIHGGEWDRGGES